MGYIQYWTINICEQWTSQSIYILLTSHMYRTLHHELVTKTDHYCIGNTADWLLANLVVGFLPLWLHPPEINLMCEVWYWSQCRQFLSVQAQDPRVKATDILWTSDILPGSKSLRSIDKIPGFLINYPSGTRIETFRIFLIPKILYISS